MFLQELFLFEKRELILSKYHLGNQFDIMEPVAIVEVENSEQILSIENYLEIEENTDYIIYLGLNIYGDYSVINMDNGRFNLGSDDFIVNLEEHNHDNDKEEHEEFKEQVPERYQNKVENYD